MQFFPGISPHYFPRPESFASVGLLERAATGHILGRFARHLLSDHVGAATSLQAKDVISHAL